MSKLSVILLNDVRELDFKKEELVNLCGKSFSKSFIVYKSPIYINGTGYVKTVKEEISLVLQNYQLKKINYFEIDQFIQKWHLSKYLNYDIKDLSGGWKKFLGLALFTNQISDGKIFFDSTRHLSDELIKIFLNNLCESNTEASFFFEYDVSYLPIDHFKFRLLLKDGRGYTSINSSEKVSDIGTEANYDWCVFE